MHFNEKVMDEALKSGMGDAPVIRRKLTQSEINWADKNIPIIGFKDYLLKNGFGFADDCQFCCHNLYSIKSMMERNNNDYFPKAKDRFLLIGSGPNGDAIAINKDNYNQIGFIGHEDPDNWSFMAIDKSISDFFWKSWNEDEYPCDFYEAQRRTS